jgi:DNA-binding transcriptional ArsR family regulator
METNPAAKALAALGHPGRLPVFRLLMRLAPQGVRPTEIALALGLKQNTLSIHMSELQAAGLTQADRRGRSLFYGVRLDQVSDLIGYLVNDAGRGALLQN